MHVRHPLRSVFMIALVVPLLAAGCGGDKGTNSPSASTSATSPSGSGGAIGTTLKDFAITLDSDTATAGTVEFEITNEGPSTHEFVVFKTDLAEDQLPVKDNAVDEQGAGITHIDEQEDIKPGTPVTFDVDLDAGNYVVICNLPAHYESGMHASLTVA